MSIVALCYVSFFFGSMCRQAKQLLLSQGLNYKQTKGFKHILKQKFWPIASLKNYN